MSPREFDLVGRDTA